MFFEVEPQATKSEKAKTYNRFHTLRVEPAERLALELLRIKLMCNLYKRCQFHPSLDGIAERLNDQD